MAKSGGAARFGAAAVAVGVALAGPGAVAAAEVAQPDPAPTADRAAPAASGKAAATRPSAASGTRSPAPARPDAGDRNAAAARAADGERMPQRRTAAADQPRRESAATAATAATSAPAAAEWARRAPGAKAITPAAPARLVSPEPPVAADAPAEQPAAAAGTPAGAAPDAAPAAGIGPAPVARMAAQSATDWLSELLSPLQAFLEGAALLVRRTLFNEAPTVSPEQTTGQVDGPISGAIGAADPEDDPIVYSVSQAPTYGTVTVDADGAYTYSPGPDFTGTDTFTVTATDTGFHINLLDIFRAPGTDANVIVRQGVTSPQIQFTFLYRRGAQFWSPAARSALESAATMLAANLVVSAPVNVTFDVTGEFSFLPSSLASAGSDLISSEPGFHPTVVQHKIQTGTDANGSAPDGEINFNFGYSWAFNGPILNSQYDFRSTATHELMHTLGFLSNVDEAGRNTYQDWTSFDQYIRTQGDVSPIGADYSWDTAYNTNLTSGNGGLFFVGPNAVAAYGRPVPLYTPSLWESGSSMSHLDDRTFVGTQQQLMNARTDTGAGVRELSDIELAIFRDLGYTLVGDPGALAFIFIGFAMRRRARRPGRNAAR